MVGPLADSRSNMPGTWSVAAVLKNATSLAEGLKAVAGDKAEILTAKGCNLMSDAEYEKRATMFGRLYTVTIVRTRSCWTRLLLWLPNRMLLWLRSVSLRK